MKLFKMYKLIKISIVQIKKVKNFYTSCCGATDGCLVLFFRLQYWCIRKQVQINCVVQIFPTSLIQLLIQKLRKPHLLLKYRCNNVYKNWSACYMCVYLCIILFRCRCGCYNVNFIQRVSNFFCHCITGYQ